MRYSHVITIGALALALSSAAACDRSTPGDRTPTAAEDEAAREAERAAALRRERDDEITRMNERVNSVERDYQKRNAEAPPRGTAGRASARISEELTEDLTNVKQAVTELATTTPENWWERHEQTMKRTADDVEADVRRMVGGRALPAAPRASDTPATPAEAASAAPFTSKRDRFVADLRARVDSMEQALDKVKARGAREAELDDLRARVKKLDDDVDRLRSASGDDWWDLSKARVNEYIDRVEASVARLDDARK